MRKYRTIVVDPPWAYKNTLVITGNAPGRTKQKGRSGASKQYSTMTIGEIKDLPVSSLAHQEGCHLYLWTTNTHLRHAWDIVEQWGFVPKQVLTWAKKPKGLIGFGAFSPCTEFVLFATTGKRSIHLSRCNRTWWEWPRSTKHSKKPDDFFNIIEKISPSPRIELFARPLSIMFPNRPGWDVWGNEVESNESITKALSGC